MSTTTDWMVDPDTYQSRAADTAVHPDGDEAVLYLALGLAGEAGEVAESIKKWRRGSSATGELDADKLEAVPAEIGDVMWYAARLADELDHDFSDVLEMNLEKLSDRQQAGDLHDHD